MVPLGYVHVADTFNARIQTFTDAGVFVKTWGTLGSGDGQFMMPAALAADGGGNVYVVDRTLARVQKFGPAPVPVAKTSWGNLKARYRE